MKIFKRLFLAMIIGQLSMADVFAVNAPVSADSLPARQLLVVIADGWSNLQGTIYAFKLSRHKWKLQFSNAVVLGKNGLGIGDGLLPLTINGAPVKKEGDLKAPAGIFSIGTAFGYADYKDARWIKNPYKRAVDTLICVDDMQSAHYNTLVDMDSTKSDWKSFEYMHRKDDYYKWGLFINHNAGVPVPGNGSCIFMHIWANDRQGTAGCTAMREADLLRILRWIDVRKKPLLVQLPKEEYSRLRDQYHLPHILFNVSSG